MSAAIRMGIDVCCRYIRYILRGRADGEEGRGRGGREVIIISSIKIVIVIVVYTSLLIALYYI